MIEKHIVLEDIDPMMLYGVGNVHLQMINGVTYTECLKMESSTSVKFETSIPMTMTLYFASSEKASIKVDGTAYQEETNSFLTIDIEAGEHELTKNKSVNLFYIDLVPNP